MQYGAGAAAGAEPTHNVNNASRLAPMRRRPYSRQRPKPPPVLPPTADAPAPLLGREATTTATSPASADAAATSILSQGAESTTALQRRG